MSVELNRIKTSFTIYEWAPGSIDGKVVGFEPNEVEASQVISNLLATAEEGVRYVAIQTTYVQGWNV